MKWKRIWALVEKDIKDYMKSKYILIAIILLPIALGALVPLQGLLYSGSFKTGETYDSKFGQFFDNILSKTVNGWDTFTNEAKAKVTLGYIMILFVAMMPIIMTSVIASETIAGERERKTMEALLASPIRETEIVTAKIISSFIPSILATIIAIFSYCIVMDIILFPHVGRIFFPDILVTMILLIISPLVTIIAVEALIMISTKVATVRDANQLGGILLIPLLAIIFGASSLYLFNSILGLILTPIILALIAGLLFKISTNLFVREKALVKFL